MITLFLYCFNCLLTYTVKEIFLQTIKDDGLITFIIIFGSLINSTGTLIFGYII